MKKLLQYLLSILFFTQISCQEKKENKKNQTMTKYEWRETISCPTGYPIDVYRGGLESADGSFTSLYLGTHSGNHGWGSAGRGMSNGVKSIPNHLHVIWISYAEKIFYEVDTNIDYEKMLGLFREGYFTPSDGDNPNPRKENYNQIIVGFAPGGIVVVWLSGPGRQIEIGRYEGKKVVIPQEEIYGLSPGPQKNMFDPEYQRKIMYEFDIVPLDIVKANEGKPIPYGLWDTYRQRYNWNVDFELPHNGITDEVDYYSLNGETEFLFGDRQIKTYQIIPDELKWNAIKSKGIPRKIYFSWYEDKDIDEGAIVFDEQEIVNAFESIGKESKEIKILIRVNIPKTSASVQLINGNQQIWLKNNKITIN